MPISTDQLMLSAVIGERQVIFIAELDLYLYGRRLSLILY